MVFADLQQTDQCVFVEASARLHTCDDVETQPQCLWACGHSFENHYDRAGLFEYGVSHYCLLSHGVL